MRIRTGFVSNSSSSSFIFALPNRPTDAKELKKLLFKTFDTIAPYDTVVTTDFAASAIFEKMNEVTICPTCKRQNVDRDPYDRDPYDGIYIRTINEFIEKNPNQVYYEINMADEDGSFWCALEHGYTFRDVPHIVESHH
jgi:hypothetical protein